MCLYTNHMEILKEISEGTLGLSDASEQLGTYYELRKSARAILLNESGKMATQHLRTYNFHKLPGGGVETGEEVKEALAREVLEEVGCSCDIVKPVGVIIEYRNSQKMIHISYCFVAHVIGRLGTPKLEIGEIEEGQETIWLPPLSVLEILEKDLPMKPEGYFILEREKTFLRKFLNMQTC